MTNDPLRVFDGIKYLQATEKNKMESPPKADTEKDQDSPTKIFDRIFVKASQEKKKREQARIVHLDG